MPLISSAPVASREALPDDAQRRLIAMRGALILGELLGVASLALFLDARLPLLPLLLIVALHLLLNGVAWLRLRAGGIGMGEIAVQMVADAASIAAMVFLTGGYANPFIFLLLVPLILAAVTLPARYVWGMALWVGLLYTLLMHYYQPLETRVSAAAAVDLHLSGMWLNFLLTGTLVAAFVGHLAAALRRRDALLAEAREQRLRDEKLFALGLQAATAAHDLATPMASLRITLDELCRDYEGDDELGPPLARLSDQLRRMEAVLDRLGNAARTRGNVAGPPLDGGAWLARTLERWGLMWPQVRVRIELEENLPALEDDPALEAVLMALLNNAAEASPEDVRLRAFRMDGSLVLEVIDQGGGLACGKVAGWGVGLDLARATLARIGATLVLDDTGLSGLQARVVLPLPEAEK